MRPLRPRALPSRTLPTALAVQAALVLLGCQRAAQPELAPDPAAKPIASATREGVPEVIEVSLARAHSLSVGGIARPSAVFDRWDRVRLRLRVHARGVGDPSTTIRAHLGALQRCSVRLAEGAHFEVELRADATARLRASKLDPPQPYPSERACFGEVFEGLGWADGVADDAELHVAIEDVRVEPIDDAGAP